METADLFIVSQEQAGERLDKLLCNSFPTHSRSYFQFLIDKGAVLLNGLPVKKREKPSVGDEIEVCFLCTEQISAQPQQIPLDILYEDESLLVVNKPAGLVVHPAPGSPSGTFVNALLYHCSQIEHAPGDLRPGIVHRLDKDTTGILVAAKTYTAHQNLIEQFSQRQIEKQYLAICVGSPKEGRLSAPIKRHPVHRQQMTVSADGKEAITTFRIRAKKGSLSIVEVELHTGRTHQIRVHLKHLGTPVLGDPVYGTASVNERHGVKTQLLHAVRLSLSHPTSKERLSFFAPPPVIMQKFIAEIEDP